MPPHTSGAGRSKLLVQTGPQAARRLSARGRPLPRAMIKFHAHGGLLDNAKGQGLPARPKCREDAPDQADDDCPPRRFNELGAG